MPGHVGRCPICSATVSLSKKERPPTFPFCSRRCKLADLDSWLSGNYRIPGPPVDPESMPPEPGSNGSRPAGDG